MFSKEIIKARLKHANRFFLALTKKWFVDVPVPCIVEARFHPCSVNIKSTTTNTCGIFLHPSGLLDCFFNN